MHIRRVLFGVVLALTFFNLALPARSDPFLYQSIPNLSSPPDTGFWQICTPCNGGSEQVYDTFTLNSASTIDAVFVVLTSYENHGSYSGPNAINVEIYNYNSGLPGTQL